MYFNVILQLLFLSNLLMIVFCKKVSNGNNNDDWWNHTVIYEIFINSFQDSDGDGTGDINGIISRLDYIAEIGVETIWITPFFESPITWHGYEISDYRNIHKQAGTMEDFHQLVKEIKQRGMKLIMDLVLNHCSWEHPWFIKSSSGAYPYRDFFIWADPKGYDNQGNPILPNNWGMVGNGKIPAWTWNSKLKKFYFHQYSRTQPDFNLRNPLLVKEILDIMKFWLDKGVDGFRLDAAKQFMEATHLKDEPIDENGFPIHIYTYDQAESYQFVHILRDFIEREYNSKDGYNRILIPEISSPINIVMQYYDHSDEYKVAHFTQNTILIEQQEIGKINATNIYDVVHTWIYNLPKRCTSSWSVENHDNGRIALKSAVEYIDIFTAISLLLPGVAFVYYGQEIGMENAIIRPDECVFGSCSQEYYRTPMQWDNSSNSGFTTNHFPWTPVHPNYWNKNVETERENPKSNLNIFKQFISLRKMPAFMYGNLYTQYMSETIFTFKRSYKNHESYMVVINFSRYLEIIGLKKSIENLPNECVVVAVTGNSEHKIGQMLDSTNFQMRPLSGVVLKI